MRLIRPLGIIIPTALFIAMVVLLLCTVLLASVSYNLDLSLDSVEKTEYRYISFGVMNTLLSDLNSGRTDVRQFTKARPQVTTSGGTLSEAWVEPLAGGKNVLVVAQTRRSGGSQAEVVKSLCTFQEFDLGRVYTNSVDGNPSVSDPIYFSDLSASGGWSQLPPAPRMRYNSEGKVEEASGEFAGTLPFVTGGPDGSLYAVYSPAIDGWNDYLSQANIPFLPNTNPVELIMAALQIVQMPFALPGPVQLASTLAAGHLPISLKWGQLSRQTFVAANRDGRTVGELSVIVQAMIDQVSDVSLSQGGMIMKYSQDQGKWAPLPPAEDAVVVQGQIQRKTGEYHVQGISGPPSAYEGGIMCPVFRKGQDLVYNYREETHDWDIVKPPGRDLLYLAADSDGTPFVQSGNQNKVYLDYFLRVLVGNLSNIQAGATDTSLHKRENDQWIKIPNPPARFFKDSGSQLQLVDLPYDEKSGPLLGGMAANGGELTVVNRPPRGSHLVDTIYKYRQGKWELVPPPPNKRFDPETGSEVQDPGLPSQLELGMGANGLLILRVPNASGPNSIFMQTKGGDYDLLPPVKPEGGPYQNFLSQTSGGRKRDGSSKGSYVVRATYF